VLCGRAVFLQPPCYESATMPRLLHLGALDVAVIVAYFAAVLLIGWRFSRVGRSAEEFLLAGRRLTLPLFVGSLVASWYGGLLGVGEIAYADGMVNWVSQGGFWYLAYLLFALLLAGRLSRSRQTTLPDQLGELHGPAARLLGMVLNFVNVLPISYVLSLGLIVHLFTGWPLPLAIVVGTSVGALYSAAGGFRAVIHVELMQFALMCVAVALVIPFAVFGLGDSAYLRAHLPPTHLTLGGRYSAQELAVWALIALSTLVDPNWYQRCYAAQSARVARLGIVCSVGFWFLFDVCTTFAGLYARAALPGVDPRLAYPLLADAILPSGLKGVFVVGLLATVMSTLDSYCFVGAMSLSHDLFRRTLRPQASDRAMVGATRLGIALTAALAMACALLFPESIKAIWKTIGSLSTAAILVPMLLGLWGWRPAGAGVSSMIGGMIGTLGWAGLRRWGGDWALRIEALGPGLGLSLTAYVIAGVRDRRRAAARREG
jgi:SSS family solute:Na+ symporter